MAASRGFGCGHRVRVAEKGACHEPVWTVGLADIKHPWRPPDSNSTKGQTFVTLLVRAQTFPPSVSSGPGWALPVLLHFLLIKFNVFIFKDLENPNTF